MATLRVVAVPDFGDLKREINNLNKRKIKIPVDSQEAKQGAQDIEKVGAAANKAGKEIEQTSKFADLMGDSFGRVTAKMAMWQIMGDMIAKVRRAFSEALETMKAVDDELVTVRKVTGMTTEELVKVEAQAYKTASAYGVAADAYLESVAAFARAGYKEQSADLAELSTKAQIVGDMTAETANQFLLSVDAAYKFKGEIKDLNRVLDGANEIDNKYATSIEKISEGLGIVAPVAAQVHVGVNELTAALGTITAVTQRSGSEAARALRAIFLNIVGDTKTEIDEGVTWTTGEIAGLQDVIKMYAKDAYDAAKATGSVINPMEAIAGLAKSMKEGVLSEQELINMVSDIGGKLRTSQLLAIIQNWDMYESMLEDYKNAYGSADKEVENALDSWTRKTNQVKNAWTEFINNLIDTSIIKGSLDVIISALTTINELIGKKDTVQEYTDQIDQLTAELESLEARESTLTETEEKRVSVLREMIEELKNRRKEESADDFKKWNAQHGSGLSFGTNYQDGVPTEQITKDAWDLRNYNTELKELSDEYHAGNLSMSEYAEKLDDLNGKYEKTVNTLRDYKEDGEQLSEAQERLIGEVETTDNLIGHLTQRVEESANAITTLEGAVSAVNEKTSVSSDNLTELLAQYPELHKYLQMTENGYVLTKTALEEYIKAQGKEYEVAYNEAQAACEAIINGENAKRVAIEATTGAVYEQVIALALASEKAFIARRVADGDTFSEAQRSYNLSEDARYWGSAIITAGNARSAERQYSRYQALAGAFTGSGGNGGGGGGGGNGSGSGSSSSSSKSAENERLKKLKEAATQAKKDAKEARDAEIKEIQDQIDALKERNKAEKDSLELEKKKEDVLKKQNALLAAQAERTIRMYNAQTGQWEWVADASKVKKAEDALKTAQENLAEYKRNKAIEDEIAELEKRKNAIKEYYDEVESRIDKTLDGLENSTTDLTDAFRELGLAIGEQQEAVEEATEEAQGGGAGSDPTRGLKPIDGKYTVDPATGNYLFNGFRRKDDTPDKVVRNGREYAAEDFPDLFDLGGILHGMGGIKATRRDEIVIPPSIAEKMLSPVADQAFTQRMSELNFIYGNGRAPDAIMRSGGAGSVVNNSGTTYNLGGVTLTEQQAKTTSVYELAQLAQGLRCYS